METMSYAFVPSFIYMSATISKCLKLYASFLNSQDFLFTSLHSLLYTTTYITVKGGKPPIKINT